MDHLIPLVAFAAWTLMLTGFLVWRILLCPDWDRQRIRVWVARHRPEWRIDRIDWDPCAGGWSADRLRCYRVDYRVGSQRRRILVKTGAFAGVWIGADQPVSRRVFRHARRESTEHEPDEVSAGSR